MGNNYNDDLEKELAGQIPEFNEPEVENQTNQTDFFDIYICKFNINLSKIQWI